MQLSDLIDLAGSSIARARSSLRKGDDPASIVLFMSADLHALALKLSEEPQHILFKRSDGTLTFDRYTCRIDPNLAGLTCYAKLADRSG